MDNVFAVGVIFENLTGEILVLHRNKNKPEGDHWGLVGGKVKDKEDEIKAVEREVYEEIGNEIDNSQLQFINSYLRGTGEQVSVFKVFKVKLPRTMNIKLNLEE